MLLEGSGRKGCATFVISGHRAMYHESNLLRMKSRESPNREQKHFFFCSCHVLRTGYSTFFITPCAPSKMLQATRIAEPRKHAVSGKLPARVHPCRRQTVSPGREAPHAAATYGMKGIQSAHVTAPYCSSQPFNVLYKYNTPPLSLVPPMPLLGKPSCETA